jgi:flagellar assembly protein FliH
MNMSYDDTSSPTMPLVEAFRYHDTFGPPMTVDIPAAEPGRNGDEKILRAVAPAQSSQQEMTRLIAEAHAQGVAHGSRQAAVRFDEEVAQERKRIADLVVEFQRQCADYYAKVELDLVQLSLAIAAKILRRESQIDPMVVAGLVKVMLERLQQKTRVVVRIRPEESASWRRYFSDQANVEIVEDASLSPKACLLETDLGVADMALESQLKEVEQGFFDLLARRPDTK